jgi:serine/threonine protein phosphatase PrpC
MPRSACGRGQRRGSERVLTAAGFSLAAPTHGVNEDCFCIAPELSLIAVADGVGGGPSGEIASQTALEGLRQVVGESDPHEDALALLRAAVRHSDALVRGLGASRPELSRASTTLCAALVGDTHVALLHVGDSRAYLVRDGMLEQLTEDHRAGSSRRRGPQGAATMAPVRRGLLLAALGAAAPCGADIFARETRPGDLLCLCTDGLSDCVPDAAILSICLCDEPLAIRCEALADAARAGRHQDDVTAVLALLEGTRQRGCDEP